MACEFSLYEFKKLGSTLDDVIGECYDKLARVIDLKYPWWPQFDKLGIIGKDTYHLPISIKGGSYNFSFSGLKSAVINLTYKEEQKGNPLRKENIASSFQKVAVESIIQKVRKTITEKKIKHFIIPDGILIIMD